MIKLCCILFVKKGDMYRYVIIGRHVLNCASRIYFVAMISSESKQIFKLYNQLDDLKEILGNHKKNQVNQIIYTAKYICKRTHMFIEYLCRQNIMSTHSHPDWQLLQRQSLWSYLDGTS